MTPSRSALISLLAALLVGALWFLFHQSEEERVRQFLHELQEKTSIAPSDTPIIKAAKVRKLVPLFSDEVRMRITVEVKDEREELSIESETLREQLSIIFLQLDTLEISFSDVDISVENGEQATVRLTALAEFRLRNDAQVFLDAWELILELKTDNTGDWKVASVEQVQIVSP